MTRAPAGETAANRSPTASLAGRSRQGRSFGPLEAGEPAPPVALSMGRSFVDLPVFPPGSREASEPPPWLQRKPSISEPADPLEREADAVADRVMRSVTLDDRDARERSGDAAAAPRERSTAGQALLRKCAQCDDEEKKKSVMTKRAPGTGAVAGGAADVALHTAGAGGGAPLPREARALFEPRFGRDFGGVRVHTGDQAGESARAVRARAYTVGGNIVFARGEYAPGTAEGRRLLAHELTHVVQQGAAGPSAGAPAGAGTGVARSADEEVDPLAGSVQEQQGAGIMRAPDDAPKAPAAGPGAKAASANPPGCDDPCGAPWIKVGPKSFVSLCKADLTTSKPSVHGVGCAPGTEGTVILATGGPAWKLVPDYAVCGIDDPDVEVGFVQTVERLWWGGVYFDRAGAAGPTAGNDGPGAGAAGPTAGNDGPGAGPAGPTAGAAGPTAGPAGPTAGPAGPDSEEAAPEGGPGGASPAPAGASPAPAGASPAAGAEMWQPADRTWVCAVNARDCKHGTTEPWITDAGGHEKLGGPAPTADDTPIVRRPSRKGGHALRRLRIDGDFHLWLIARSKKTGSVVYINNWDIAGNVVATIPDEAGPCNISQWQTSGELSVTDNGPGQGASTPVLKGNCAADVKKDC
jgi:hypothetical protein